MAMSERSEKLLVGALLEAFSQPGWRTVMVGLSPTLLAKLENLLEELLAQCGTSTARDAVQAREDVRLLGERRVVILIEPRP